MNCPATAAWVATTPAEDIAASLLEVDTVEEGYALFRSVRQSRPALADEVLCRLYDVACYKVGDSCFSKDAPANEQDLWFVSTLAGTFDDVVESIPLAASLEAAQALAVQHLKLEDVFFGRNPHATFH